jgi:hypothetical protein
MNAKTSFINDKNLAEWWASIANDRRFDTMLLHAGNIAFEACPSAEQREGILRFKDILLTISQPDAAPVDFPKPGLHHDLGSPRKTAPPTPEKPAK